jgi:hypothetical protein
METDQKTLDSLSLLGYILAKQDGAVFTAEQEAFYAAIRAKYETPVNRSN